MIVRMLRDITLIGFDYRQSLPFPADWSMYSIHEGPSGSGTQTVESRNRGRGGGEGMGRGDTHFGQGAKGGGRAAGKGVGRGGPEGSHRQEERAPHDFATAGSSSRGSGGPFSFHDPRLPPSHIEGPTSSTRRTDEWPETQRLFDHDGEPRAPMGRGQYVIPSGAQWAGAHTLTRRCHRNPERQLVRAGDESHLDRRLTQYVHPPTTAPARARPQLLIGGPGHNAGDSRFIDPSDEVSGDDVSGADSSELHLCCTRALLFNTLELPNRSSFSEPAIIAEAMRIHWQEAGAPLGRGMLLEQQCAIALNMALASAVIYPDHSTIVIIGSVRTDRISLTIIEGRYYQRSWIEANGTAGRLLTRRELHMVIARLQLEVLSPTSLSELQLDEVGTSPPRSCLEKTITDASEISEPDSGSDDVLLLVSASDPSDASAAEDCLNGPPGNLAKELVARDIPSDADPVVSTVGEEVNRSHKQTGRRSDLFVSVPHQSDALEACPNGERPDTVEHRFLFPDVRTSYPVVSTDAETQRLLSPACTNAQGHRL